MEFLTVPAALTSLERVHEFVIDATAQAGLDDHTAWQVQLAVDEAVTNIMQHGYDSGQDGVIELGWQIVRDELLITLRDRGRRFDPDSVPTPDVTSPLEERQSGGLGLFLMNKLMDEVSFESDATGNLLTMIKRLARRDLAVSTFTLSGRLDAVGSRDALVEPQAAIANGARRVLLDLSAVTFLSSSGLRALLLLRKELLAHGGDLRLCALRPHVYEVFTITGFTQVFAIHSTREDALAAFGQS